MNLSELIRGDKGKLPPQLAKRMLALSMKDDWHTLSAASGLPVDVLRSIFDSKDPTAKQMTKVANALKWSLKETFDATGWCEDEQYASN